MDEEGFDCLVVRLSVRFEFVMVMVIVVVMFSSIVSIMILVAFSVIVFRECMMMMLFVLIEQSGSSEIVPLPLIFRRVKSSVLHFSNRLSG